MLPYDVHGTGAPVLLIHAGIADRSMWSEHLPWLADAGYRAIAIDLPGFGEAAVRPGRQAPWEDVLETMRELDGAPAVIVGNSFGAAVALRVAAVAPVAVRAMMLVSAPPLELEPSPVLTAAWEAEEAALEGEGIDAAVAAVLDAWTRPDGLASVRERVAAMQRRAFELQAAAPAGVEEAPDPVEERPEVLSALTMPVLAAAGEHDMPDFAAAVGELCALLPQCRPVEIAGAGHLAPLETPDTFRDLLGAFLRETSPVGS